MFKCRYCDHGLASEQGRNAHEEAKHPRFKCNYCVLTFRSREAQVHHEDTHRFECNLCGTIFREVQALWQHQRTTPHFECSYCTNKLFTNVLRKAHEVSCDYNPAKEEELSTSDDEGSESLASPSRSSHSTLDEGEMFHSTSVLSSTDTNGEGTTIAQPCTCTRSLEPGMCSICQQKSSLSSDTDEPVPDDAERIVSADGNNQDDSKDHQVVRFQCTPCLEFFETEESFRDHVCAFRTMLRPHCPVCYTQFDDRLLLQKHLEGLQLFSCQFCLTRCCSDEMLLDHLFSHPTCGKCGHSFADDLALCAVRILHSHDHFIDKHCHSLILNLFVSTWRRTTRSWSVGIAMALLSRTTVSSCITRTLPHIQLVRSAAWARETRRICARFV
jgi:hypothetical protein